MWVPLWGCGVVRGHGAGGLGLGLEGSVGLRLRYQGATLLFSLERGLGIALQAMQEKKAHILIYLSKLTSQSLQIVTAAMKLKDACSLEEKL